MSSACSYKAEYGLIMQQQPFEPLESEYMHVYGWSDTACNNYKVLPPPQDPKVFMQESTTYHESCLCDVECKSKNEEDCHIDSDASSNVSLTQTLLFARKHQFL